MRSNKDKYLEFIKKHDLHLYFQPWWLDAVCDNKWDVILVYHGDEIAAVLPYYQPKVNYFKMPPFTQTLGFYIIYPEGIDSSKIYSYEKKILNQLIKNFPDFKYFHQNFNPKNSNWQPFFWQGYSCSVRYTFYIDLQKEQNFIFNCSKKKRNLIIKAKNKFEVISDNFTSIEFYKKHQKALLSQGKKISYKYEILEKFWNAGVLNNSLKVFSAITPNGEVVSCKVTFRDYNTIYCIVGFHNPGKESNGSKDLLHIAIMDYAKTQGLKRFDFEGSMIEGVADNIYGFGATQIPYFQITKDSRSFIEKSIDYLNKKIKI